MSCPKITKWNSYIKLSLLFKEVQAYGNLHIWVNVSLTKETPKGHIFMAGGTDISLWVSKLQ